jgi:PhzF family phenazine biosynthesis protein
VELTPTPPASSSQNRQQVVSISIDGIMTASLTWVDAFTDTAFAGNPAGVCLPREPMSAEYMQALAKELGIAETAFVMPTARSDTFDLRWFSPLVEIDLCGHATLASAHAMRERGVVDGTHPLTFMTRSGPLMASFEPDRIELDFPADPVTPASLPDALKDEWESPLIGVGRTSFFLMVTLASAAAVRCYRPNLAAIAATGDNAVLLTAKGDPGSGADYVLRVFGPNVGIDEDPATGSAQCAAGPYWAEVLGRPSLVAHQVSPRGAVLYVRPEGARVRIGGNAVTVFTGNV